MTADSHAPLTLTPAQRAIVESWDVYARRRFERYAGTLEFLDRKPAATAELEAFERITLELSERATRKTGGGQ